MPGVSASLARLLVGGLVGLLIGLDRERAEMRKGRKIFAGVRTFPLIALLGTASALLQPLVGVSLLVVSGVAVAGIAVVSYARSAGDAHVGATTEIAAVVTFVLGVLAGHGALLVAAATGVAVAVLLVAKVELERWSRALGEGEVHAALELAVISAIVLPLLPNQGYGPWGSGNPFEIWLVVVLVSSVSFAGFVAMRIWGVHRGLTLAALFGALVSSTAVTVAMAGRTRENREQSRGPAAAVVLASSVMAVRLLVLVGVVAAPVVPKLWPALGAMAAVGAIAATYLLLAARGDEKPEQAAAVGNPFSLRSALTFGLAYAAIELAVNAARAFFGSRGVLGAAALAGLVDVDAISLAVSEGVREGPQVATAATAVAVAAIANTIAKAGIAVAAGAGRFRRQVAVALALMAVAAAVAAAVSSGLLG